MTGTATVGGNSRATEHAVLSTVTAALKAAHAAGDMAALQTALTQVETLWRVFVVEVSNDGNPLPKPLREGIVNIGMAVLNEINGKAPKDVDVDFILDINKAIIDGLASQ